MLYYFILKFLKLFDIYIAASRFFSLGDKVSLTWDLRSHPSDAYSNALPVDIASLKSEVK